MEYVIKTDRPFEEIETLTIDALQRLGLVVQRTFSLRSAVSGSTNTKESNRHHPEYSVLMLHASGDHRRRRGYLTIYQRGGRTVISPFLTPVDNRQSLCFGIGNSATSADADAAADADADADLVAALVLSGLEFCVDVAEGKECIDLGKAAE